MVVRANPDFGEPFRRTWVRSVGIAAIALVLLAGITLLIRGATVDEGLGDRIEAAARASDGEPVLLRDFTDFAWSRVCLFPPGASAAFVTQEFGYDWTHALSADDVTVVFATGPTVRRQTHLAPELAEMPPPGGTCLQAEVAAVQFRSP